MTTEPAQPAEPRGASAVTTEPDDAAPGDAQKPSRAGRDLKAAVGVGVGLAVVVVGALFLWKVAFLAVLVLAVGIGAWELRRALTSGGIHAPVIPLGIGLVSMIVTAYFRGPESLVLAFGLTVLGVLIWRLADGPAGAARDVGGAVLIALYPGFLGGFASLLLASDQGQLKVFIFLLVTVFSDIGGYAVGVLFGKHPMAPSVSPKKSWEGFVGSLLSCALVGALALRFLLGLPWWMGAVLGLALAVSATIGDLIESSIKRDLGVKDMGTLLPGHGGLMDRLDSLVIALPVAWLLLEIMAPAV